MSNQWQKRLTTSLLCPSGNVVVARRPGPDLAMKAGKIARIFKDKKMDGLTIDEQLEFYEKLPDHELEKLMDFARILIADVVIQPVLSLHPKEGQLSPDDVPLTDFWFIFQWAMNGGRDIPVKLTEGETTVEAVENFPAESAPSDNVSEDGPTM